jgi:uncharacterized membrane protein
LGSERVIGEIAPRRFLLLVLGFGLAFAFVNPPYAVNDEDAHLARIYELASGQLLTRSDAESGQYHLVPADYPERAAEYVMVRRLRGGRVNAQKLWLTLGARRATTLVRTHGRAGTYSPVSYAPHVAAMWAIRHFDVGALIHLYVVRVAALLAYALLCLGAVLASARLAWLFIIVALTPMALTQAASVSGDGLVIGFALLFFALLGKGACTEERLSQKELVLLVASAVALTLCKPVYVVVVLALPALSFSGAYAKTKRALFPLAVLALALGFYGAWSYQNRNMVGPPDVIYDSDQQLAFLRENPLHTFVVAFRTLLKNGDELFVQSFFVRNQLSRVARFSGAMAALLHLQVCAAVALGSLKRSFPGGVVTRRVSVALFLACWLSLIGSVAGALYVCCTRIGAPDMHILQGRYFIPAMPALLLALGLVGSPLFSRFLRARNGARIFAIACFNNLLCLLVVIGWHYYPPNFAWPY